MDNVLNFLADNYKWFMIGAGVLLLALIGFIVDGKRKKKDDSSNTPAQLPTNGQVNTVQDLNNQAVAQTPAGPAQTNVAAPAQPVAVQAPVGEPSLDGLDAPASAPQQGGETLTFGPVEAAPAEEEKLVIEMPNGSLSEEVLESAPAVSTEAAPTVPEAPLTIEQAVGVESTTPAVGGQIPMQESGPAPVMEAAPEMPAAPMMEAAPAEPMPVSMTPETPTPAAPAPAPEVAQPAPMPTPQEVYQNTIQQ